MKNRSYSKYTFHGRTDYILQPSPGKELEMIVLGHSDQQPPWSDPDLHLHTDIFEYYFLWRGAFYFLVGDLALTLHGPKILFIKPDVPHCVLNRSAPHQGFTIRTPLRADKRECKERKVEKAF